MTRGFTCALQEILLVRQLVLQPWILQVTKGLKKGAEYYNLITLI